MHVWYVVRGTVPGVVCAGWSRATVCEGHCMWGAAAAVLCTKGSLGASTGTVCAGCCDRGATATCQVWWPGRLRQQAPAGCTAAPPRAPPRRMLHHRRPPGTSVRTCVRTVLKSAPITARSKKARPNQSPDCHPTEQRQRQRSLTQGFPRSLSEKKTFFSFAHTRKKGREIAKFPSTIEAPV
jgi:hypothetical protein